jgi:nicotinamide phosphoribosyltransferase
VLGVGSFSMMCLENHDPFNDSFSYSPYTRDTFGIAVKATYAEDANGNPIMIMKQPKGCDWKKSQKGCCIVKHDKKGNYTCEDNHTYDEAYGVGDLEVVFHDGHFHKNHKQSLKEIRERLHG